MINIRNIARKRIINRVFISNNYGYSFAELLIIVFVAITVISAAVSMLTFSTRDTMNSIMNWVLGIMGSGY